MLSTAEDMLTGRTVPLTPAPITLRTWQSTLPLEEHDAAHPESPLSLYHEAQGYGFVWGHIVERTLPPHAEDPLGMLCWDVVLPEAQRQFDEAGGNLAELADLALHFLDTYMPQHAPSWLRVTDGDLPAAFGLVVDIPHGVAARQWLAATFLPHGLPQLLTFLLRVNAEAAQENVEAQD